jgi:hypothetical protein
VQAKHSLPWLIWILMALHLFMAAIPWGYLCLQAPSGRYASNNYHFVKDLGEVGNSSALSKFNNDRTQELPVTGWCAMADECVSVAGRKWYNDDAERWQYDWSGDVACAGDKLNACILSCRELPNQHDCEEKDSNGKLKYVTGSFVSRGGQLHL